MIISDPISHQNGHDKTSYLYSIISLFAITFMVFLLAGCNLGTTSPIEATSVPADSISQPDDDRLVVAWAAGGDLMVWQTGDTIPRRIASGGAVQAFIAPDGGRIAFTRGPQSRPETLWVIDTTGTGERQLVGEQPATYTPGINQVGDVVWQDERTLYFNTLQEQAPFFEPRNDLYRVDAVTRDLTLIAAAGDGGRIVVSPDGQYLLSIYHGNYGSQDGVIQIHAPDGLADSEDILYFEGVSTASEFRFYPEIHWTEDNQTALFAIPDPDLIYDAFESQDTEPTQLWRVPLNAPGTQEMIGTVDASFFGQPVWSDDGSAMIYFATGDNPNELVAYLAAQDGSNPRELYRGMIGSIDTPQWIPGTTRFIYPAPDTNGGAARQYLINGVTIPERPLSDEAIFAVRFVSDTQYVYLAQGDGRQEMRTATLDGNSQFIGSLNGLPVFDARKVAGG